MQQMNQFTESGIDDADLRPFQRRYEPRIRESIKVYNKDDFMFKQYYQCDLDSVLCELRRDWPLNHKAVRVVSSCGYCEQIGTLG